MFSRKRNHIKFDAVIRSKHSPRRKRDLFVKGLKKQKISLRWVLIGVFAVLLIATSVYFFFLSDKFLLTEVFIEGAENKELKENVESYYNTIAQNKKFYFIRQNKSFSFPKEEFEDTIRRVIPKVKEANIEIKIPNSILIKIKARKENGVWCNYHDIDKSGNCYFYDSEGVIYETALKSLKGSLIVYIRDGRFKNSILGDKVLDKALIEYTEKLIQFLDSVDLRPEYIFIKNDTDVHAGFNQGWEAYFLRENNMQESVENLKLVLEKEIGNRVGELEYIDLRLGNKVFYNYKNSKS